ncbi:hypothetical protein [Gudongella sp. SC589]|jgi:iron(III) transport system permease protein
MALAILYCYVVFGLGFLIPTIQLLNWAFLTYSEILDVKFMEYFITP